MKPATSSNVVFQQNSGVVAGFAREKHAIAKDNDGHEPELTSVCQQPREDLDAYCEVDPDPSSMGFGWKSVKDIRGTKSTWRVSRNDDMDELKFTYCKNPCPWCRFVAVLQAKVPSLANRFAFLYDNGRTDPESKSTPLISCGLRKFQACLLLRERWHSRSMPELFLFWQMPGG